MENEINGNNTGVIAGGRVDYAMADCAVEIDELIATLENMKENGLEYVVMSSGNYRGARWQSIGTSWSWTEDED